MKMTRLVATLGVCLFAGMSQAQTTVTRWTFNDTTASATTPPTAPHFPAYPGSALLIGGTQPQSSVTPAGYPSGSGSSDGGNSWGIANFPAQGTASGTAGYEFRTDCTGFASVTFEFDYRASNGCSKYWDVLYSTNGGVTYTSFFPVNALPYLTTPGNTNFFNNFGNNFPAGTFLTLPAAADNNPDVRVRIVQIVDPIGGTGNYITNSTTGTYTPGNVTASSTMRLDAVEFRGLSANPSIAAQVSPTAVCLGASSTIVVSATLTPASLGTISNTHTVTANLTQLGGGAAVAGNDLGGGLYTWTLSDASVAAGLKTITVNVVDDQNRTALTTVNVGVGDCAAASANAVVIAQVWGGGGGTTTPATSPKQDYVVLFNRCDSPVNIHGWSLQYASATGGGGFGQKLDIVDNTDNDVTIGAKSYFLIQTNVAALTDSGVELSTLRVPDFAATGAAGTGLNMSGSTSATSGGGRVALVRTPTLVGADCGACTIVDMVGWGIAVCYEGFGAAPVFTANTNALFRKSNACQDSNQSFNDFEQFSANPINSTDPANTACTTVCDKCLADIDDDGDYTNGYNPDGGVDINDLLTFLSGFENGDLGVDLDNDGDPLCGTPDEGVDINDLLFMLSRFEAGC